MSKKSTWAARGVALLVTALSLSAADNVPADSGGDSMLNGKYWMRQVIYSLKSTGAADTGISLIGAITFDGKGNYTFLGQQSDTITNKVASVSHTGSYRVGVNGVASLDTIAFPLEGAGETIYGGVGANGIFSGSATEGFYNDLFVAIPAGTKILTNSSLSGAFLIGDLDTPGGDPAKARNSLFQVTADGMGGFASVTVAGRDATVNPSVARPSFNVSGASYGFLSDGSATLTFPAPAGSTASSAIFAGTKTLYASADGNYVLGGDPAGYDIFFGFRPLATPTSASVAAAYQGVYYFGSVDSDMSDPNSPYFVSENGSINAFAGLNEFWHQRTSPFNDLPYDLTYDSYNHTIAADGSFSNAYYKTIVSADGQSMMVVGNATDYTLLVGIHAPAVATSSVFLNPLGILNAASFSPVTSPVAPGELITLFGSNLTGTPATATAASAPFPTSLAGVQVMINNRPAPVFAVSPTQLSVIVPYATSGPYASIQVINNGKPSNVVTMYNRGCSAGIFAVPSTGSGYGAILHADYSLVSPTKPAKQGEIVLVYLTGLGEVKPAVADGAPGGAGPFSLTPSQALVYFGSEPGTVYYSGLAPGLAGLYQVNVQVPSDAATGDVQLTLSGAGCQASQVRIPIVAGP